MRLGIKRTMTPDADPLINFIWSVAELLRDTFRRAEYQDVVLPLTLLRRLDASAAAPPLAPLLTDPEHLADNLQAYVEKLEPPVRALLTQLELGRTIRRLDQAGLLLPVMERFCALDLHPDRVPNHQMGTLYEELVRKFNEALDENPGEHFTPREVARLMAELLLAPDGERLRQPDLTLTVADPCCGTGGMLVAFQESVHALNPAADVRLFGQEINPQTWAICQADLFLKRGDWRDAQNIRLGSTLSADGHADRRFDYQLTNPPYGKDWRSDRQHVLREVSLGPQGRFGAGVPRVSDGQLLFVQHMLSRMKSPAQGGGRVAIITSGAPLFAGDAGSGESQIRRWLLEHDWLEAVVALPGQLFYNTGIATYVWLLSNRKPPHRRGRVQLINAADLWAPLRKPVGAKRRRLDPAHIAEIVRLYATCAQNARAQILPTSAFGYRQVRLYLTPTRRDTERVPLEHKLDDFLAREVHPHFPDARPDTRYRDPQDGEVGRVGYRINPPAHFVRLAPPPSPGDLLAQLRDLFAEIAAAQQRLVTLGIQPNAPAQETGLPWPERIPTHWRLARLKYIARVTMGQSPPSRDYNTQGHGLPFLQGNAEFGAEHPTPRLYCPTATRQAAPGDLLLSVRAPVGALNIADQRYGIGRGLCAIRPHPDVLDRRYAWYMLQAAGAALRAVATGSTFEAVSVEQVRGLHCPLPPLEEQHAIAARLDDQVARLDRLITRHTEALQYLGALRKALVATAVTGAVEPREE